MNAEQFVFWLSGYLTGSKDNDPEPTIEDIKTALKVVKLSALVCFKFEESQ